MVYVNQIKRTEPLYLPETDDISIQLLTILQSVYQARRLIMNSFADKCTKNNSRFK